MTSETAQKKPGTALMSVGLLLAGVALLLIVVVVAGGGSLTIYTAAAFVLGLLLAVAGFARRLLATVESR